MRGFLFICKVVPNLIPVLKNILNILIVDDNLNFIKRMISILDDVKYPKNISVASDYNSALQQIESCRQHILLLDINMPGKSGIDLLRIIKEQLPAMEVIMLTNHAEAFYREQCKELGARFFLDKSNDFLQVPDIVNAYCQRNSETS